MSQISIVNMSIGFWLIFLSAASGPFLAFEAQEAFIHEASHWQSWQILLIRSAHGHTNLFGILHILVGLTLPYCRISRRRAYAETLGLGLGSLAMSLLLILRSFMPPSPQISILGILTGAFLSAALVAILHHAASLSMRVYTDSI